MTAADSPSLLRDAAQRLREAAAGANPGPWANEGVKHIEARVATFHVDGPAGGWVAKAGYRADAAYIALVAPVVGVAVADWLDREADLHDALSATGDLLRAASDGLDAGEVRVQFAADASGAAMSTMPQALAVARSILCEEA